MAVLFLALAGVADLVSMVLRGAILQQAAVDEMRGRMQGVFTVVVAGGPRLADLLHGTIGAAIGTTATITGGGVLVVVVMVLVLLAFPAFWRYRPPPRPRPAISWGRRPESLPSRQLVGQGWYVSKSATDAADQVSGVSDVLVDRAGATGQTATRLVRWSASEHVRIARQTSMFRRALFSGH